ncbi:MAG TPA: enoyl-CoA hydratase/isomerase family protein [Streptosporangiaceae bacterium]|nr:enoyl-CoA hydratase/isomerase family protein [Streptosporangiaceae bacterium]
MTTAHLPAGLSAPDLTDWASSQPAADGPFGPVSQAVSAFLVRGQEVAGRLPGARGAVSEILNGARDTYLRAHAAGLYDALTRGCTRPLRVEDLVYRAAAEVPGLTPTPEEMDAERGRMLADKWGIEFAQGLLVSHVLALPRAGRHLVESMLRPVPAAFEHLEEFRATGAADLGPVRITRRGRAGVLEITNPKHLNAEDDVTLDLTEAAVDMILLDPDIEVGVIRGGVVEHPRYPGTRVFGSGINLTRLYHGRIDFLFYLVRDLGYVNKIYRGIRPERDAIEKLWVAAVERYAVGGACQLLHVMDHVIATRGSRLFLPARKEGIIPGASNLRLPRFVGDRAARQAIFSGREWTAGEPDTALLVDEVVQPGDMDGALDARIEALTNSGLVNAAANRAALRAGQEPLEKFREYMATFSVEQARCHLSPALVRNLEVHWNARERTL